MAVTVYGTNATKVLDPTPENILAPGQMKGKLRAMQDDRTADGTEVVDSLIYMGENLPTGARIIDVILQTNDLGAGVTLDVGDAEDDDRYISAVDCSGAIIVHMEAAHIGGKHYEIDMSETAADNQVIVKVHAGTITPGKIVKLTVIYVIE